MRQTEHQAKKIPLKSDINKNFGISKKNIAADLILRVNLIGDIYFFLRRNMYEKIYSNFFDGPFFLECSSS